MAKKKTPPTNKLAKKCPQCKTPMQSGVTITKGDTVERRELCTRCGQRDVSRTTDEVKD